MLTAAGAAEQLSPAAAAGVEAGGDLARERHVRELGVAFRRVLRTVGRMRGRDTHLGGSEISHAQFELLIELGERGGLPAGELAAAARMSPGTVTQMLDHLAQCGHVERVRSEADRRVVVSRLTAQGRRKIEAKRQAWAARWEQALEDMPAEDLRAATRVLQRLAEMLEDYPAETACTAPAAARARAVAAPPQPVDRAQ
jgi:DNA-binding MarR family transcriptional regulator